MKFEDVKPRMLAIEGDPAEVDFYYIVSRNKNALNIAVIHKRLDSPWKVYQRYIDQKEWGINPKIFNNTYPIKRLFDGIFTR